MKLTKRKRNCVAGGVLVSVLCCAAFIMMLGISNTLNEIDKTLISEDASEILASTGVSDGEKISLAVVYRDNGEDLIEFEDDNDENEVSEARKDVDNVVAAIEKEYDGEIEMQYSSNGAVFSFYKNEFYPLDNKNAVNGEHNSLFEMEFALPFMVIADGNEYFEITADDDTYVYIDNEAVISMKNMKEATTGKIMIDEDGKVLVAVGNENYKNSGVKVNKGESELIEVFHADKNTENGSSFNLITKGMNLTVENVKIANSKKERVEIAYDPTDATYVAPLGETKVFNRDNSRGLSLLVVVEGVAVILFAVFIVLGVKYLIKEKTK